MSGIDFNNTTPIYRQITAAACSRILNREWPDGEKVPSVRELSTELTVNTRTVMKALEYLQNHGIRQPRRGMGFYTVENARELVLKLRKDEFFEDVVPNLASQLRDLGITPDELAKYLDKVMKSE